MKSYAIQPVITLAFTSLLFIIMAFRNDKWSKKYAFVAGVNVGVLMAIILNELFE